jgi:hypothetical protein
MEKRNKKKLTNKVNPETAATILRKLPMTEAFFFYSEVGQYTNQTATDLADFHEKLKKVSSNSIEFHVKRGDFSRWVKEILKDEYLTDGIEGISPLLQGEELRNYLRKIVEKRVKQLETVKKKAQVR